MIAYISKKEVVMAKKYVCTLCGHIGKPKKLIKGNILVEIFLYLFFIIPGLFYSIWRTSGKAVACPSCKEGTMIPANSPKGQKLIAENK